MQKTKIEWATHSWNPMRGCSAVSPGCLNCYAGTMASRFAKKGHGFHGFAEANGKPGGGRWTGKVELIPHKLTEPLRWTDQGRRRVFVNSMSDLFHENVSFEEIAAVIGVIAASPRHQFLTLTKRARRMREWFEWFHGHGNAPLGPSYWSDGRDIRRVRIGNRNRDAGTRAMTFADWYVGDRILDKLENGYRVSWPLPNWWVGVSAEDQKRWDERVPQLLRCPAAVRFVSAEPLLGPINGLLDMCSSPNIDQVIVGGESGPGARPCRLEWIDSIVEQCKAAGVAPYVKQIGADPTQLEGSKYSWIKSNSHLCLKHPKGGDPDEWPGGLKRFPRQEVAVA